MKKLTVLGLSFLMTAGMGLEANAEMLDAVGSTAVNSTQNSASFEEDPPRRVRRPRRGRRIGRRFPHRPGRNFSFMTCRAGLRTYRGYISRVWYGRAWGIRSNMTYRRACRAALNACLSYNRYSYNRGGRCVVLGKKDLNGLEAVPATFINAN